MTFKQFFSLLLYSVLVTHLGAQSARADDPVAERFLACGSIENNSARLACFDSIVLEQTEGTQVAADVLQEERERQAFGNADVTVIEEPESVNVVLIRWTKGPTGNWTFETEDGQIWRQTDNEFLRLRGERYNATIKEGAISGYLMNIDGWSSPIRVRRIR